MLLLVCLASNQGLSQVSQEVLDSLVIEMGEIDELALQEFISNRGESPSKRLSITDYFVDVARRRIHRGDYEYGIQILASLIRQQNLLQRKQVEIRYLLGYCYFASREFSKAIWEYNFVLTNTSKSDTRYLSSFYLANLYYLKGEYALGSSVLDEAEYIIEKSHSKITLKILNLKAQIFSKIGDETNAIKNIDLSIARCSNSNDLHQAHFIKANILLTFDRYERALYYLMKSLEYKTIESNIIRVYNNISYSYIKQESPQALKYINLSRDMLDSMFSTTYHNQYAVMYQNLAEYHAMMQNYDLALKTIDTCIFNHCYGNATVGTPSQYEIELFFLEDKMSLTDFYEVKLDILEQAKANRVAEIDVKIDALFTDLDELIQSIREERFDDDNRFFQQSKLSRFYRKAMYYYIQEGAIEKAYYFLQQMKSIILLEKIQHHQAHQLLPKEHQERLESFQDSIKSLSSSPSDSISVSAKLQHVQVSYLNYRNQLKNSFPRYFEARFSEQKLDIENSMTILDDDEVIVNYYLDSTSIHIFTVNSADGLRYQSLPFLAEDHARLDRLIREVRSEPSLLDWNYQSFQTYITDSNLLTSKLFTSDLENAKHLIVIPHSKLLYLPFEALYDSDPDCPFQVCKRSFSYASSHFLWSKLQDSKPVDKHSVFIYSPYEEEGKEQYLPNASVESLVIEECFPAEKFKSITKSSFFSECQGSSIHHILSHANLNEESSSLTNISLGPSQEQIFMQDIVSNPFNSSMVVLSACNSGNGAFVQGEGVLSLARSFIQSGAESIVMSGHAVPDYASSQIMTSFYQGLSEGQSKHSALANSKRKYIESSSHLNAHPYFWAGFTLQGNDSPLISSDFSLIYFLSSLFLLLILLFVVIKSGVIK